ncbi:phage tail protein [Oceanobacillus profundus]|uniref:phage tail protein n=1 Tax=Oceanobacillus profundus TaxID=372463 RepID=UPI00203D4DDC|nr:phage tail protein [Oceanobacillus profundus]MCM3396781.1 phage tail protein [Oceanobacillus profundus]
MVEIRQSSIATFLDNVDTREFNIYQRERVVIPTPEEDNEHIEIKGRHGSLTKKNGFKDIELPIDFYFYEKASFKVTFRHAKVKFFNAKTLMLNDDDSVFYKIKSVVIDNALNDVLEVGEFTVNFRLDPFQYELSDSAKTITAQRTLSNPGYESEPIITAHVAGTGKIYINNVPITIQNINGTIIIDSELMNAYGNNNGIITNLNNHMIGDFPVFKHGSNVIYFDGAISKLEVNPRWRWV